MSFWTKEQYIAVGKIRELKDFILDNTTTTDARAIVLLEKSKSYLKMLDEISHTLSSLENAILKDICRDVDAILKPEEEEA